MGPVVLHLYKGQPAPVGHGPGLAGGEVVGVQIAGHHPRRSAEQPQLRVQGGAVVVEGLGVFEVPDVLAEKDMPPPPGGKARLLLGPEGQHPVGGAVRQKQRLGRIAPAAAEKVGPPPPDRDEGIVAAVDDGPVVQQVAVRHPLQPAEGLGVVGHHRAAGPVGAGQDQGGRAAGAAVGQQDVQGGVGQQDAQPPVLAQGGEGRLQRGGVGPLFQQDDGPPGALQHSGLLL